MNSTMNVIKNTAKDQAGYFNLEISRECQTVQDVIDNMLTRLEELTSVVQMIKLKNAECCLAVSEDISKYRRDITTLSKKVNMVNEIIQKLDSNVNILEKQVEKAELDFGVKTETKIKNLLKPFLKKSSVNNVAITPQDIVQLESVLENFEDDIYN